MRRSCVEHWGKLTRQDQILLRCYLLGRQGPRRLWGCGPASRSNTVLGPAGTKAGRSVAPEAALPPSSICRMCSASHLPGAATCERCGRISLWLTWGERRELVQNWFIFKIMTVWARPANKNTLGKNLSLLEDREKFPPPAVGLALSLVGVWNVLRCPFIFLAHLCMCTVFFWVWVLACCKTALFYS